MSNEKWLNSGYSLNVELMGFSDKQNVGCGRSQGIKNGIKLFDLSNLTE